MVEMNGTDARDGKRDRAVNPTEALLERAINGGEQCMTLRKTTLRQMSGNFL